MRNVLFVTARQAALEWVALAKPMRELVELQGDAATDAKSTATTSSQPQAPDVQAPAEAPVAESITARAEQESKKTLHALARVNERARLPVWRTVLYNLVLAGTILTLCYCLRDAANICSGELGYAQHTRSYTCNLNSTDLAAGTYLSRLSDFRDNGKDCPSGAICLTCFGPSNRDAVGALLIAFLAFSCILILVEILERLRLPFRSKDVRNIFSDTVSKQFNEGIALAKLCLNRPYDAPGSSKLLSEEMEKAYDAVYKARTASGETLPERLAAGSHTVPALDVEKEQEPPVSSQLCAAFYVVSLLGVFLFSLLYAAEALHDDRNIGLYYKRDDSHFLNVAIHFCTALSVLMPLLSCVSDVSKCGWPPWTKDSFNALTTSEATFAVVTRSDGHLVRSLYRDGRLATKTWFKFCVQDVQRRGKILLPSPTNAEKHLVSVSVHLDLENIYIYWVLTKKVAKKIRLYVAQET